MGIPVNFFRRLGFLSIALGLVLPMLWGCAQRESAPEMEVANGNGVEVIPREDQHRVDVFMDGERFTAYIFDDSLEVLKKPVLYPLNAPGAISVVRGYPIEPRLGERTDHPHHIGHWLNYGDVNGLDFWNNSDAVSEEEEDQMGHIVHRDVRRANSGAEQGVLEITAEWRGPDEEVLLEEDTRFVFRRDGDQRMIDRVTTLTAVNGPVEMHDNKEGMMAVRVRRELEHNEDGNVVVVGHDGTPTEEEVLDPSVITGEYVNAEGITGTAVWGTRSPWMVLNGVVEEEPIAVAILDHSENVGYPTYWHARGYGLFAANPLGQAVFSEGEEQLSYELSDGESTTFRYRILIHRGHLDAEQMNPLHKEFVNSVQ